MTVSSTTNRNSFTCTGVQEFPFTFKIFAKTDLVIILRDTEGEETTLTLTTDYTISAGPWETGGIVTTVESYTSGTLVIIRELPQTQGMDYVENDPFPADTHEQGLDRGVMILQELTEKIARMLILAKSSSYSDLSLPDPVASKLLAWKDDLSGIKNVEIKNQGDLSVTDYIKTLLDDEDATVALATLGLTVSDYIKTLLDDEDAATALITLGLTATKDEINAVADGITTTALQINKIDGILGATKGLVTRPKFAWKAVDEIYVGAGGYELNGKHVYWNSQLTSNIGTPDASDWYYLYLDDSEITASGLIDTTKLIWSNVEPAWSEAKRGAYNGDDRCIFGWPTNASQEGLEFFHEGGLVLLADQILELDGGSATSFTDIALNIPKFTTLARVIMDLSWYTAGGKAYWRTNGQIGTVGHLVAHLRASTQEAISTIPVITDDSQIIEYKVDSGDLKLYIYTDGWYFPIGM